MIRIIQSSPVVANQDDEDETEHFDALRKTGFYGKAGAGCVVMAKSTGRMLLPLRSRAVEQPGTYGVWGGAINPGDNPKTAAMREFEEETGCKQHIEMTPIYVFRSPTGFVYHNFLAVVPDEFKPKLNWETDKAIWCALNKLPHPLHFGLKAVLDDPESMAKIRKVADHASNPS